MITKFASLNLKRHPLGQQELLQAWDAADVLLLDHLAKIDAKYLNNHSLSKPRVLIINDAFGAIACSLAQWPYQSWGDSHCAHQATQFNAKQNFPFLAAHCIASTDAPTGIFDRVLIKIPKTLALLEQQLFDLQTLIDANTIIIGAGMTKYTHKSHTKLFEKYIGATTTSLAVKKARLIFPTIEARTLAKHPPFPSSYYNNTVNLTLYNHANVFSRDSLDIGTRFMLEQFNHLPTRASSPLHIVDLGCGNGILGIKAKQHYDNNAKQHCHISFVDESYMALASARDNVNEAFNAQSHCDYLASDSFTQTNLQNIDLILCNPPFHQSHTVSTHIASSMFNDSKRALKKGGQLWIIANRHLSYQSKLNTIFGNCRLIAENNKFVVLVARLK